MTQGMRLKRIRDSLGMNQGPFAESLGLKQSHLSKIEKEKMAIPADAAAELFRRYRIHPNWFFFGEGGDEPVYMDELVTRTELEKERQEKMALVEENRQLYKKLYEQEQAKADRLKTS